MNYLKYISIIGCLAILETASLPTTNDESSPCSEEGRYANEEDCTKYYECTLDGEGTLVRESRSCFGQAFDPEKKICVKASEVEGCNVRQGRNYGVSNKYGHLCTGNVNYACGDCSTQITCIGTQAYETKCDKEFRCSTEADRFNGAVCHVKYEEKCRCTADNSYRQDPYTNTTFFVCATEDSLPADYTCPTGMYFNETAKDCLNEDGTPSCSEQGTYAFPDDCSKYYQCTFTQEGWVQAKDSCPINLLFNDKIGQCEDPCTWKEQDFTCEVEGRFKDIRDCTQFYECITELEGGFRTMTRSCPPNLEWNDNIKKCISKFESNCEVKKTGPIEQCENNYLAICEPATYIQIQDNTLALENILAISQDDEEISETTNEVNPTETEEPEQPTETTEPEETEESETTNEILAETENLPEIQPEAPAAEIPVEVQQ